MPDIILIENHPPRVRIRKYRGHTFKLPATQCRYGTWDEWVEQRDSGDSIFVWTDQQLACARRNGGYIGEVLGIGCYLVNADPVHAS